MEGADKGVELGIREREVFAMSTTNVVPTMGMPWGRLCVLCGGTRSSPSLSLLFGLLDSTFALCTCCVLLFPAREEAVGAKSLLVRGLPLLCFALLSGWLLDRMGIGWWASLLAGLHLLWRGGALVMADLFFRWSPWRLLVLQLQRIAVAYIVILVKLSDSCF